MTQAKHTKGPWHVEMAEVYAVRDAEGGRIAIMTNLRGAHGLGGRRDGAEVAANTLVTAAAPELLEALKQFIDEKVDYMRINNLGDPEQTHTVKLGRAAIAKAEGQS